MLLRSHLLLYIIAILSSLIIEQAKSQVDVAAGSYSCYPCGRQMCGFANGGRDDVIIDPLSLGFGQNTERTVEPKTCKEIQYLSDMRQLDPELCSLYSSITRGTDDPCDCQSRTQPFQESSTGQACIDPIQPAECKLCGRDNKIVGDPERVLPDPMFPVSCGSLVDSQRENMNEGNGGYSGFLCSQLQTLFADHCQCVIPSELSTVTTCIPQEDIHGRVCYADSDCCAGECRYIHTWKNHGKVCTFRPDESHLMQEGWTNGPQPDEEESAISNQAPPAPEQEEALAVESTESPTPFPTERSTLAPTEPPTAPPTAPPTNEPTKEPTEPPTKSPTEGPTKQPTDSPTKVPTEGPTKQPTDSPTKVPTEGPTKQPTDSPTKGPTASPTSAPTASPTIEPTQEPTELPTKGPTEGPTNRPTESPTKEPTEGPTKQPTESPTKEPTEGPTKQPTESPTKEPTEGPTRHPTKSPTKQPTEGPTRQPTEAPTKEPTRQPTESPTMKPTSSPTKQPTEAPILVSSNNIVNQAPPDPSNNNDDEEESRATDDDECATDSDCDTSDEQCIYIASEGVLKCLATNPCREGLSTRGGAGGRLRNRVPEIALGMGTPSGC